MIRKKNAGFTLIELMIVVAIIAIIASVAIPKLMSARLSANEAAAIATLRSISSAQAQIQSSSAIDTDADGGGEYGYLAELAGGSPMRIAGGGPPLTAIAGGAGDVLNPSILSTAFGNVAGSVTTRSGYCFQIWLPAAGAAPVAGIIEDATGGKALAPFPGGNNAEILWCAYAWPLQAGNSGNRAFFVNQEGDLLQTGNRTGALTAAATGPNFDAAFTTPVDMSSPVRVAAAAAHDSASLNIWVPVQ